MLVTITVQTAEEPIPTTSASAPEPSASVSVSPSPTAPAVSVTHLGSGTALLVALLIAVTTAVIGLIIIKARNGKLIDREPSRSNNVDARSPVNDDDKSIMRAWLAIALVVGLLVFGAVTFAIDDAQLRSALIGGLVASAGSAIAYYFSSKNADTARRDILGAVFQLCTVPQLKGLSVVDAEAKVAAVGLTLVVHPPNATGTTVLAQVPDAGSSARRGDGVHVDV